MERNRQRALPLALIAIAALLVAARIGSSVLKPKATNANLVQWVSFDEAVQLAASSNKLILFDFTADWCSPCHDLDAEVFANPQLAREINASFIPVRIVDREQEEGKNAPVVEELQRRFAVRAFPTIVFADAAGAERGRMEGFRAREEFQRVMERMR
jgi:thiol:disulfide interchange protein